MSWYILVRWSLGNINENLSFEMRHGDEPLASRGCGATLNGEFWYFGFGQKVSVSTKKIFILRRNYFSHSRSAKLLVVNWPGNRIWLLTSRFQHAIRFSNRHPEFCCVFLLQMSKHAIRKLSFFCLYIFFQFRWRKLPVDGIYKVLTQTHIGPFKLQRKTTSCRM